MSWWMFPEEVVVEDRHESTQVKSILEIRYPNQSKELPAMVDRRLPRLNVCNSNRTLSGGPQTVQQMEIQREGAFVIANELPKSDDLLG